MTLGPKAASLLSAAKSQKTELSAFVGDSQVPEAHHIASEASSRLSTAPSGASSAASSLSSVASEAVPDMASPSSVVSQASKRVSGGVMAQAVPERQVVLDERVDDDDDDESYAASIKSMLDGAKGQAASLTQAVQDAIKVRPTQGTYESVNSVAQKQYYSALSAASNALRGTTPAVGEGVLQSASARYEEAVAA